MKENKISIRRISFMMMFGIILVFSFVNTKSFASTSPKDVELIIPKENSWSGENYDHDTKTKTGANGKAFIRSITWNRNYRLRMTMTGQWGDYSGIQTSPTTVTLPGVQDGTKSLPKGHWYYLRGHAPNIVARSTIRGTWYSN